MFSRKTLLLINSIFFLVSIIFLNSDNTLNGINNNSNNSLIVFPTTFQVLSGFSENNSFAKVIRVIDGDTIEIENREKVRYIGVDSPERDGEGECYFDEARNKNKELILGKTVRLEKDVSERDRYGRLLRYVYADDVFINEVLVRQGYARIATYPPDVVYKDLFLEAEKYARENKLGLWGECN